MQDTRPAKTIAHPNTKFHYQRPLSEKDLALLRSHAKEIAKVNPDAILVRFHRRRRLTEWQPYEKVQFSYGEQSFAGKPIVKRGWL